MGTLRVESPKKASSNIILFLMCAWRGSEYKGKNSVYRKILRANVGGAFACFSCISCAFLRCFSSLRAYSAACCAGVFLQNEAQPPPLSCFAAHSRATAADASSCSCEIRKRSPSHPSPASLRHPAAWPRQQGVCESHHAGIPSESNHDSVEHVVHINEGDVYVFSRIVRSKSSTRQ